MYFTADDFKQIENYLKHASLRDSELPVCTTLLGTEEIIIVLDGLNKRTTLSEIVSLASGNLATIPAPTITYNTTTQKIQIRANLATTIFYSVDSEVIDSEYTEPFSVSDGQVIRAYASYTTGERTLISETSTYTYKQASSALISSYYYWGIVTDLTILDSMTALNFRNVALGSDDTDHVTSFDISGNDAVFYVLYPKDTLVSPTIYDNSIGGIDNVTWITKELDDDWNLKYFIVDSDKLSVKNIIYTA